MIEVDLTDSNDAIERRQVEREARDEQVRLQQRLQKRQLRKPKESEQSKFQRVREIMGR